MSYNDFQEPPDVINERLFLQQSNTVLKSQIDSMRSTFKDIKEIVTKAVELDDFTRQLLLDNINRVLNNNSRRY